MYSNRKGNGLLSKVLMVTASSIITAMVLTLFIPAYISRRLNLPDTMENRQAPNIAEENLTGQDIEQELDESDIVNVANRVMPSVVGISTRNVTPDNIFDAGEDQGNWSVGSGVIVSENGYILTNHHVIGENPNRIIVTLANGETVNAATQWSDPVLDLAVIRINRTGLTPAVLGDAESIKVGEVAVAIGNPLGLQFQRTVTAGIISAVNRTISIDVDGKENYMEGLIQTDASINPGNSGGPLINSKGEIIGINTIKVVSAEGMGFAIPINVTKPIITSFINEGNYSTPYMGLFAYDKMVAKYINQGMDIQKGVYIAEIDENSPAYRAGIREGDIITHICEKEVNTMIELREEMYKCGAGNECTLIYIRNGKTYETKFNLGVKTRDGLLTR